MPLKPQNIVQAAQADLARRERNSDPDRWWTAENYAFHRRHVQRAKSVKHLVEMAIKHPKIAEGTVKRSTQIIYGDAELLKEALAMVSEETNAGE